MLAFLLMINKIQTSTSAVWTSRQPAPLLCDRQNAASEPRHVPVPRIVFCEACETRVSALKNMLKLSLTALLLLGVVVAAQETPNYGPAVGCIPPTLPDPKPQGVPISPLKPGEKPNFILLMTDDQGWDDVGSHQPHKPGETSKFVNTPNMDKFLRGSTEFDNFYVTPMCAQSRAALITGRDYPKTGTKLVSGGYDFVNRDEVTFAEIMAANGYSTAHFGKWHNGRSLGYEPWTMGFQESWLPEQYIHLDNLMQHNGEYVQTHGLMEQVLMDKVLAYLTNQQTSNKPFFMFYAPNCIHRGSMRPGVGPKWTRPSPEPYKAKYRPLAAKYNISGSTIEVWAMLEYMDDVLGRLFNFLDNSPLKRKTYVMVMSDNGSELFLGEMGNKMERMPSGMQGYKRDVEEGGVRNFLGVQGPGVEAGVIDSTLTDLTDILPTMADLAGIAKNSNWDGVSIKKLLLVGNGLRSTARRGDGTSKANSQQLDRFVFSLGPLCWDGDSVPVLGADREILRPQLLFDYDRGGYPNKELIKYYNMASDTPLTGFQHCIAVRWRDYKWIGRTNKVYRFKGQSHIDLPCNEVTGPEATKLAAVAQAAARSWWKSITAEPHSFKKPTFYLGLDGWSVTNVFPDGAHDRTKGRVTLLPNGAKGFSQPGDQLCFGLQIITAGTYNVVVIYTSKLQATFELSVGTYPEIQSGSAQSLTTQLPVQSNMTGRIMGQLNLSTSHGRPTEGCLTLVSSKSLGKPVFINLGVIRFTRQDSSGAHQDWIDPGTEPIGIAAVPADFLTDTSTEKLNAAGNNVTNAMGFAPGVPIAAPAPGLDLNGEYAWLGRPTLEKSNAYNGTKSTNIVNRIHQQGSGKHLGGGVAGGGVHMENHHWAGSRHIGVSFLHPHLNATRAMKQVERDAIARARAQAAKRQQWLGLGEADNTKQRWQEFRLRHNWPDGQSKLESMFSPYHAEGIATCRECLPDL